MLSVICYYVIINYLVYYIFFFFNDTATTEIYTLSLHDALPIFGGPLAVAREPVVGALHEVPLVGHGRRSEEHTSELQSQSNIVCRLLLEKKKKLRQCSHSLGK